MILSNLITDAQISNGTNGPGFITDYCGWAAGAGLNLEIKNEAILPINFYTSTGAGTLLNQKMKITATAAWATDGFVGIGSAPPNGTTNFATFPNYRLDVDQGDININMTRRGYRIGDGFVGTSNYVLWHNGDITNIFSRCWCS